MVREMVSDKGIVRSFYDFQFMEDLLSPFLAPRRGFYDRGDVKSFNGQEEKSFDVRSYDDIPRKYYVLVITMIVRKDTSLFAWFENRDFDTFRPSFALGR